jgi:hypothetical protein
MTARIRFAAFLTFSPLAAPWLLAACGGASFSLESKDAGESDASVDSGLPDASPEASPDAAPADGGGCPPGMSTCVSCEGIPTCGQVCPNIACPVDSGVRDAAPPIDASRDVCFPNDATAPALKACTASDECTYERHVTDCCGAVTLVGVAASKATAFGVCEQAWDDQFPRCACLVAPGVTTEDGKQDLDGAAPQVTCVPGGMGSGGHCQTSL